MQVSLVKIKDTVFLHTDCGSLVLTCYHGYIDMVQWLLRNDVDVDQCRDDGVTGLFMASKSEWTYQYSQIAVRKNSDVDLCCTDGYTPLINSCGGNNTRLVQLLMKYKPDIDAQTCYGGNALLYSVLLGNMEITQLLLQNNADCNVCMHKDGTTPLFYACEVGHEDIVRVLLDKGADTQICRLDGKSPLGIAIDNGHTSIEFILTEHKKRADQHSA
ncbi:unnamed protein product [Mytilus edulis]|uniref:Uncharacterized protein n=1 Tax=Mytilus edulis TaxID=6550 RepID=A0A8S3RVD6_MYTED|nr:unnamed protein product [Mytilus edulis]